MFTQVSPAILFNQSAGSDTQYLPFALAALPYLLASFGYHGNVPGLVKYYRKDSKSVVRSLLIGTLIALVIYILWQYVIQGISLAIRLSKLLLKAAILMHYYAKWTHPLAIVQSLNF